MDYCAPLGIPHSQFLSWKNEDQDKALAWSIEKRLTCQECGTRPADWLDEKGFPVEPSPYTLKSRKCIGCVDMEEAREGKTQEELKGIRFYYVREQAKVEDE